VRTLALLLILVAAGSASGQSQVSPLDTESVLYSFCSQANCADGDQPSAGLIVDASGNFYGTTTLGGSITVCGPRRCGTAFKLDTSGNYTVLHDFCSQANCADGETPYAGLTEDASGNLYGTTEYGGANHIDPNANGGGTVFKLDSAGNYTVLYNFCSQANCADGYLPYAGLIEDASGNLYGTTSVGGANHGGTVFKLDSAGNYTDLYDFCSQANCADGEMSYAGLTEDASGNLYGTTQFGGANDGGTVFKLDSAGKFTVLYDFCSQANCTDGYLSYAGLIKDASGNLYGTTYSGGATNGYGGGNSGPTTGGGTVFKLDSAGKFTVLHTFCAQAACADGGNPKGSLIEDSSGNLYGTTTFGGTPPLLGAGIAFKLDSAGNYTVLYNFCSQANCADGYLPYAGLIEDASGNLYGTTYMGGSVVNDNLNGVIFRLTAPDFTIGANPATLTIGSPGQQGTTTIAITPKGGFNQTITFSGASCSGLPTGASCSFSPSSVTPSGGAVYTTLTIATTATSSAIPYWPLVHKQSLFLALVLPGLFVLVPTSRGKRWSAKEIGVMLVLLLGFSLIGLNGCGGGSASGAGGGGGGGGTPVGTYIVTVTATASSLSHATTLTLVVE
jgi:uncharacterized repeat protein (TIGR03803 family)